MLQKKPKQPKETNWKQKIQKPQNENICLIYLNAENNCKFQIVYFQSKCIEVVALRKQNACSYVKNNDIWQSFLRKIAFCSQILLKLMQIIIKSADI